MAAVVPGAALARVEHKILPTEAHSAASSGLAPCTNDTQVRNPIDSYGRRSWPAWASQWRSSYLGFLNADEMVAPFTTHAAWGNCLLSYAEGAVPQHAWNAKHIKVYDTPMIPLIRSADVNTSITM